MSWTCAPDNVGPVKKRGYIWHKPITFQETVVPRSGWCEQISSSELQVSQSKLKVLEIQGQVIDSIIGPPPRWTILGCPATGLARNPEVGARRRNCQGSMSCWSAWANIKTYQNHVVAKHPGAPCTSKVWNLFRVVRLYMCQSQKLDCIKQISYPGWSSIH